MKRPRFSAVFLFIFIFYYSLEKYNKSKSAKAEKSGITAKTLGLPSYVKLAD